MTKKYLKESIKLGERELTIETGKVAKQADGSVVIKYGDTMLLVAATSARTMKEGMDFFPMTIEYREAAFSAGRIPGNYFRREGRPNEKETLTCRLIDQPALEGQRGREIDRPQQIRLQGQGSSLALRKRGRLEGHALLPKRNGPTNDCP